MEMSRYVAEILTTTRHGGLVDRDVYVRAESAEAARALVATKCPNAVIGFVGEVSP
jgi:hypothetical protein